MNISVIGLGVGNVAIELSKNYKVKGYDHDNNKFMN